MNDKAAKKAASAIRKAFWSKFDAALTEKVASKQARLDELEELSAEVAKRLGVKEELGGKTAGLGNEFEAALPPLDVEDADEPDEPDEEEPADDGAL